MKTPEQDAVPPIRRADVRPEANREAPDRERAENVALRAKLGRVERLITTPHSWWVGNGDDGKTQVVRVTDLRAALKDDE